MKKFKKILLRFFSHFLPTCLFYLYWYDWIHFGRAGLFFKHTISCEALSKQCSVNCFCPKAQRKKFLGLMHCCHPFEEHQTKYEPWSVLCGSCETSESCSCVSWGYKGPLVGTGSSPQTHHTCIGQFGAMTSSAILKKFSNKKTAFFTWTH